MTAVVDFGGEEYEVPDGGRLTVGRESDIAIDDNPYMHRRFLEFSHRDGLLWVSNVGSSLSATLSDVEGLAQSWLAPGAHLPIVFSRTAIWFTAGPTTYELDILLEDPPYVSAGVSSIPSGDTTLGRVTFSPDQRLLILALAEAVLRRGNRGAGSVPPSAVAAERLGWTITKFNRKLDNVCEKLAKSGVRGLTAVGDRQASNRRARLVEYAVSTRLVTSADLHWLDEAVAAGPH